MVQVTGPYHAHTCQALDQVTSILTTVGDYASAKAYAQKCLAIAVHLHGFDSQEALINHNRLGALESELGNHLVAAQHFMTCRYLVLLMAGERHQELASLYARLAMIYDAADEAETVLACYSRAKQHTYDIMQNCNLKIALAAVLFKHGLVHEAAEMQSVAYNIFKELMTGRDDQQLADIKETLEHYLRAVNEQKVASINMVNEKIKELSAKMDAAKLGQQGSGAKTTIVPTPQVQQMTDQELLDSFAAIDAREEKARKNAKKNAKKVAKK